MKSSRSDLKSVACYDQRRGGGVYVHPTGWLMGEGIWMHAWLICMSPTIFTRLSLASSGKYYPAFFLDVFAAGFPRVRGFPL